MADQIHAKNAENPVMVYSKSYCPYCTSVKQLFSNYQVDAKYAELDQIGMPSARLCCDWWAQQVCMVVHGRPLVGTCTIVITDQRQLLLIATS